MPQSGSCFNLVFSYTVRVFPTKNYACALHPYCMNQHITQPSVKTKRLLQVGCAWS